jgi:anti-anti-sigma factor
MGLAEFRREGNLLRIWGDLDQPMDVRFDIEARALLDEARAGGKKDLVIDLRGLSCMGSQYIGALTAIFAEARRMGATLTVKAKARVADVLQQCGLERVLNIETE